MSPSHGINVTPLIDVLLVLLIIFMVITPLAPTGLDAIVPHPPQPGPPSERIVITVRGDSAVLLNRERVELDSLPARLRRLSKSSPGVVFVQAEPGLEFRQVAAVIDICPVTEVCFAVGYESLGSFSSLFRSLVGRSPLANRRSLRRVFTVPLLAPYRFIPACFLQSFGSRPF